MDFDPSRRVVLLQINQWFHTHGAKQQYFVSAGGNVVHANPYVILEKIASTFMHTLAREEQVLIKV